VRSSGSLGPVAALAALLLVVQATVLFGLRVGDTRVLFDPADVAPSIELYGDRALSQTFLAQADGLTAITVYPIARGPAAGPVALTLEVGGQTVARATVATADFLARPEWTWTFPPVAESARREFRLEVGVPDAAEGSGLHLAIGPPTYAGGALHVGGRAQWGDLRFQTRSQFARVVDQLQRRPTVRHGAWVPVAACAAIVLLAASLSALTIGLMRDRAP
jgi:hypothetical protein